MSTILTHTPLWVWVVLALLIKRGLAATQPNCIALSRLFLLPLAFSVWGVMGLPHGGLSFAIASAVVGLTLGAAAGWRLFAGQSGYVWDQQSRQLQRPGNWLILICSMIAFTFKFGLGTVAGRYPELIASPGGALSAGLVSGVTSGLLWGASITQLLLGLRYHNLTEPRG